MSYLLNEFEIISSNNSINENKYNTQKMSKTTSYRIKKILRPLMKILNRKNHKSTRTVSSKIEKSYEEYNWNSNLSEVEENSLNEELEEKLFDDIEINCGGSNAAIYIYSGLNQREIQIQPVEKEQKYIPVCFARTEAGTFFWTKIQKQCDADLIRPINCSSNYQQPEVQYVGDRWGQA